MIHEQPHPQQPTRRAVLSAGAAVAVAGSLCGCAAIFGSSTEADLTVSAVDGSFRVPLAAVPAVSAPKPYLVVAVTGQEEKVMLFRTGEGVPRALGMVCTHRGCDVGFDGQRGVVVCPCHGSEYDTSGGNLKGPAERPLSGFATTLDGADVVVTAAG